jgi:hypothetical protein
MVRGKRRLPVVLHVDHGTSKPAKDRNQAANIRGVEPYGGLVQHVEHVFQVTDEAHR